VNGKALVNGLNLREMEMSDMLDVIHYFFEEDMNYSTGEQAEAHGKVRKNLYRSMYNREYRYAAHSMGNGKTTYGGTEADFNSAEFDSSVPTEAEAPVSVFNPRASQTKAYTPSTNFNPDAAKPFGEVLDQPLG
jgi:hypothetical protein